MRPRHVCRGALAVFLSWTAATTCSPPRPGHAVPPGEGAPDAAASRTALESESGADGAADAATEVVASAAQPEPVVPVTLADSINTFARDLHRELSKEKGNLFYSPLSISIALSMTYAGARGETAEQIAKVLHLDPEPTEVHGEYAKLIEKISSEPTRGAPEVRLANRLWLQNGMALLPEFAEVTGAQYRAPVELLDFVSEPEPARLAINAWVARRTNERIRDLLPPGAVNSTVRLVLTNAIYFKAAWAVPFRKDLTRDEVFFVNGVTERKTPTMNGVVAGRYAHLGDAQVVELPYARDAGTELAMVIILPKRRNGLPGVERRFGREGVGPYLVDLAPTQVQLSLPRFTASVELRLRPHLEKLGMPLAFSAADFSGITAKRGLSIDDVYHKSFVETAETGTEAAAGTAVVMARISDSPPPPEVRVAHPFLVCLRDRKSGVVLFAGRIVSPSS